MNDKHGMNYLYKDGKAYSIEEIQKSVRAQFAEEYKTCRTEKRITQRTLAMATGIPQPNITRFESKDSNPTLEMMVKMSIALGMKLNISLEKIDE